MSLALTRFISSAGIHTRVYYGPDRKPWQSATLPGTISPTASEVAPGVFQIVEDRGQIDVTPPGGLVPSNRAEEQDTAHPRLQQGPSGSTGVAPGRRSADLGLHGCCHGLDLICASYTEPIAAVSRHRPDDAQLDGNTAFVLDTLPGGRLVVETRSRVSAREVTVWRRFEADDVPIFRTRPAHLGVGQAIQLPDGCRSGRSGEAKGLSLVTDTR